MIEKVQDDQDFAVVLHNCGNILGNCTQAMVAITVTPAAYHFLYGIKSKWRKR